MLRVRFRAIQRPAQGISRRWVTTALLERRTRLWDQEKKRQAEASPTPDPAPLTLSLFGSKQITVPGGWTPLDVARKYEQSAAKKYVAAQINSTTPWDMRRPLPATVDTLEMVKFDTNDALAKQVFWHSSAHVMGAALEKVYGDDLLLCDGPPLSDGGFFYEFLLLSNSRAERLDRRPYAERIHDLCGTPEALKSLKFLTPADLVEVKKAAAKIVNEKHTFDRLEVSNEFACELFLDNPFKLHFLDRARQNQHATGGSTGSDATVSLYRCGDMIDLCRGPHVPVTTMLQGMSFDKVSSAHWVGHLDDSSQNSPVLNRVYGISFPSTQLLKEHQTAVQAAAKRDHRVIGKEQKLFMMHPWAPGSGFILPHGQRMVNRIMDAIRSKYAEFGFDEVSTPLMYNKKLWEMSGHWENYRDDMFVISSAQKTGIESNESCCNGDHHHESEPEFGLKPMNCPGHCLIFASDQRSYRDLPIRYADFSPLHRNEVAGALSGLTRVRKFHQDDGHIFCTHDQIASEMAKCLEFIDGMYKIFHFSSYELVLSTRPENFIGSVEDWDRAEDALREILDKSGKKWTVNEGDGAFYGPKIDVRVRDALRRKHQTATIQLDFQLPQRFDLKYTGSDGQTHRPVMIHRAVLGSIERMLAVLIEHWGGQWPFWVNPRQAVVIPVTASDKAPEIQQYAQHVQEVLAGSNDKSPGHRFFVDLDTSGSWLNRAVRDAQVAKYGFILVVGEKEVESGTVDVRQRQGGKRIGSMAIAEVRQMFEELADTYQ